MNKDEMKIESNKVQEILEDFSEELSHNNRHKLARVFNLIDWEEKRIEELTEQNTSLLTSVENLNKSVQELERKLEQTEKDLADYQFNYPTIKELQKEKAELKSIADFQTSSNMDRYFQLKRSKEQLTKAKEIIKKLIGAIHIWDCKNLEQVEAEAEQFISEVEDEKD